LWRDQVWELLDDRVGSVEIGYVFEGAHGSHAWRYWCVRAMLVGVIVCESLCTGWMTVRIEPCRSNHYLFPGTTRIESVALSLSGPSWK